MRLFAQLSWYFRREWQRYLGAVALLIIIAILQLIPPKWWATSWMALPNNITPPHG